MSVVVLAVAGTLWLRDSVDLLHFLVALLGRLPLITPVWVYAAAMLAAGAMIVPPFIAAVAATRPLLRPALGTAALLVAVAITGGLAYAAPAYTYDEPQRRAVRMFIEPDAATATLEVASQEPGLDLESGAPGRLVSGHRCRARQRPVAAFRAAVRLSHDRSAPRRRRRPRRPST